MIDSFTALLAQYARYSERTAWLYANSSHPEFDIYDARAQRTGAKFAALRDEMSESFSLCPVELCELVSEVAG